ncbi:hypothetical protein [Brevundimonas sp.]|uniref:hypothetical protein n=1 Tax=Brevundimonas sp. TaxID=1871086 RepID=UPI002737B547|nr:hypothetical protein [Brevundimonas sp.]MDP3802730.1 hypothetical protein [Brevundimonas sp.]
MAGSIRFHEIIYRKADLQRMPPLDRRYFVMLGQLYNDLAQLLIQLLYHYPLAWAETEPMPLRARRSAAALMTLRQLAARIWEVNSLIDGQFNQFAKSYDRDKAIKPLVGKLRAYLQAPNAAKAVRHSAAAHFDQKMIDQGIESLGDEVELRDFFTHSAGNMTFDGADTVLLFGMVRSLEEVWGEKISEPFPALQRLALELRDGASLILDMVVPLLAAVYNRHLEDPFKTSTVSVLFDQPEADEVSAPVFICGPNEKDDEARAVSNASARRAELRYPGEGMTPWERFQRTRN